MATAFGRIWHSTGDGTWTSQETGTDATLTAIWGSGANDIYVSANSNLILHSNGDGTWKHMVFNAGRTFRDIWGSGADDVYAVGGGATRFNNGMWVEPPESIAPMGEPIYGIWGSSSTDVYAAGTRKWMYHSKGDGSWKAEATTAVNLLDVSGSGSGDVYAISGSQVFRSTGDGVWTSQSLPALNGGTQPEGLQSVWALNPSAIYLTTSGGRLLRSGGDGVWVVQQIDPALVGAVFGIWGSSPTNLYVAARTGVYHGSSP